MPISIILASEIRKYMYIERNIDKELAAWKMEPYRKPLLVRGVRQCGKTSSIRHLGASFKYFCEINFEKMPSAKRIFSGDIDISKITAELEELSGVPIIDGDTLLFLDELQESSEAITAIRYFYEDRPNLHVIGAGSLLEFALRHISSFGVGRIQSLYMMPLSFAEFLAAIGEDILIQSLVKASLDTPLSEVAHQKLLSLYKVFIVVGGMPEAVLRYAETKSILQARSVHQDIMSTLYDDFGKYEDAGISPEILRSILRFVLSRIGSQISYNKHTIPGLDSKTISKGLEILSNAWLVPIVYASSCSSLPIASSINMKRMKPLFIDTGLYLHAAGLDVSEFAIETEFQKLNIGNVCELSVGLELLKAMDSHVHPELYFWTRDADGSNRGTAEVDYVIQKGSSIIPIEVKARTQGGMKSLWAFLEKGTSAYGIRTSLENFAEMDKIQIYPLYAICKAL